MKRWRVQYIIGLDTKLIVDRGRLDEVVIANGILHAECMGGNSWHIIIGDVHLTAFVRKGQGADGKVHVFEKH